MQSTESVKHVEITTPCFPESTGNEVMMIPVFDALSELLGCLDVGWIRLFPESPTGIEAWVWKRIRRNKMDNDQAYRRAKKKVEARLGFYVHLAIYLTINGLIYMGHPAAFPGNF